MASCPAECRRWGDTPVPVFSAELDERLQGGSQQSLYSAAAALTNIQPHSLLERSRSTRRRGLAQRLPGDARRPVTRLARVSPVLTEFQRQASSALLELWRSWSEAGTGRRVRARARGTGSGTTDNEASSVRSRARRCREKRCSSRRRHPRRRLGHLAPQNTLIAARAVLSGRADEKRLDFGSKVTQSRSDRGARQAPPGLRRSAGRVRRARRSSRARLATGRGWLGGSSGRRCRSTRRSWS